jgi:hypothetical protein
MGLLPGGGGENRQLKPGADDIHDAEVIEEGETGKP